MACPLNPLDCVKGVAKGAANGCFLVDRILVRQGGG